MDDEADFSSDFLLSNTELDDILRGTSTCTHTHTCNPPGPDTAAHTHTCYHTHTRIIASDASEEAEGEEKPKITRKPLGNREAVRKYREKKKAHTAYLEEEVKKLRFINQQLVKKLQGQAALQAEVVRLRALLADLRGKVDSELGMFPFHKQCNGSSFHCDADIQCNGGTMAMVGWESTCEPPNVSCQIYQNGNSVQSTEVEPANSLDLMGSLVSAASHAE